MNNRSMANYSLKGLTMTSQTFFDNKACAQLDKEAIKTFKKGCSAHPTNSCSSVWFTLCSAGFILYCIVIAWMSMWAHLWFPGPSKLWGRQHDWK